MISPTLSRNLELLDSIQRILPSPKGRLLPQKHTQNTHTLCRQHCRHPTALPPRCLPPPSCCRCPPPPSCCRRPPLCQRHHQTQLPCCCCRRCAAATATALPPLPPPHCLPTTPLPTAADLPPPPMLRFCHSPRAADASATLPAVIVPLPHLHCRLCNI